MNVKGIPMNDYPLAFLVVLGMILLPSVVIGPILHIKKQMVLKIHSLHL